MSHNVEQKKPADGPFEFARLREFVDSATTLDLPEHTEVRCMTIGRGGVFILATEHFPVSDEDADGAPSPAPAGVSPSGGDTAVDSGKDTIISQDSTGPFVTWRRWWGRKIVARKLTLGDVRTLVERADQLGLPTERYIVRALRVRGSQEYVHSVSAEPRAA